MSLETATFVANLVITNPDGGDARSTADDHLRLIKAALTRTFPKLDGAVSLSAAQVMYLNDVSASVQLQLNQLRDGSATANFAVDSRYANSASLATIATTALTANSASYAALAGTATLALTANSASYAVRAGFAESASYAANAGTADSADSADFANAATIATFATEATNAQFLQSALPAVVATADTIAVRNSDGDLFAHYLHQDSGAETPSVGHVACMRDLDGAWRVTSVAQLGSYMSARNISTKTGTNKTLAAGSGPPSLTGSTNGDVWFYY